MDKNAIAILLKLKKTCTHMQFLAARSLWTNFWLLKYTIPFATCKHIDNNCLVIFLMASSLISAFSATFSFGLSRFKYERRLPSLIYGMMMQGASLRSKETPINGRTLTWSKLFIFKLSSIIASTSGLLYPPAEHMQE